MWVWVWVRVGVKGWGVHHSGQTSHGGSSRGMVILAKKLRQRDSSVRPHCASDCSRQREGVDPR